MWNTSNQYFIFKLNKRQFSVFPLCTHTSMCAYTYTPVIDIQQLCMAARTCNTCLKKASVCVFLSSFAVYKDLCQVSLKYVSHGWEEESSKWRIEAITNLMTVFGSTAKLGGVLATTGFQRITPSQLCLSAISEASVGGEDKELQLEIINNRNGHMWMTWTPYNIKTGLCYKMLSRFTF